MNKIEDEKYLKLQLNNKYADIWFFVKKISPHTYENIWDFNYPEVVGLEFTLCFRKTGKNTWETVETDLEDGRTSTFATRSWIVTIPTPTEIVLKMIK